MWVLGGPLPLEPIGLYALRRGGLLGLVNLDIPNTENRAFMNLFGKRLGKNNNNKQNRANPDKGKEKK